MAGDHEGVRLGRECLPKIFVEFSSEKCRFYAFYCENLLVAKNWDQGMLNGPPGWAKDVKPMGWGENLAGGSTLPTPRQRPP